MPPWQSWHVGLLLVGLYILLLTSLSAHLIATLFGYDFIFLTHFTDAVFNVAIIAMIGVLLAPFLRLIDNASHTRKIVSDIYENVSQFNSPVASFTSHQTLTNLIATVDTYDAPLIFLGLNDKDMVRDLLIILQSKRQGALYIHPRVLDSLLDVMDFRDTTLERMVYVTDCPRESCAVFSIDQFGKVSCILFRYLPRQTVSRLDENWWSVTLNPGLSYPEYLYNTYDHHYGRESAILLRNSLKARLLLDVNARRITQNRLLNADHFVVANKAVAYSYATSLLRHAQLSIRNPRKRLPSLSVIFYT